MSQYCSDSYWNEAKAVADFYLSWLWLVLSSHWASIQTGMVFFQSCNIKILNDGGEWIGETILVLLSRSIINKLFSASANIQLRKFGFRERLELVQYWSHKLIYFTYSKLCKSLFWPITLTVFSNTRK